MVTGPIEGTLVDATIANGAVSIVPWPENPSPWSPEPEFCQQITPVPFLGNTFEAGEPPGIVPPDIPDEPCELVHEGVGAVVDVVEVGLVTAFSL